MVLAGKHRTASIAAHALWAGMLAPAQAALFTHVLFDHRPGQPTRTLVDGGAVVTAVESVIQ